MHARASERADCLLRTRDIHACSHGPQQVHPRPRQVVVRLTFANEIPLRGEGGEGVPQSVMPSSFYQGACCAATSHRGTVAPRHRRSARMYPRRRPTPFRPFLRGSPISAVVRSLVSRQAMLSSSTSGRRQNQLPLMLSFAGVAVEGRKMPSPQRRQTKDLR